MTWMIEIDDCEDVDSWYHDVASLIILPEIREFRAMSAWDIIRQVAGRLLRSIHLPDQLIERVLYREFMNENVVWTPHLELDGPLEWYSVDAANDDDGWHWRSRVPCIASNWDMLHEPGAEFHRAVELHPSVHLVPGFAKYRIHVIPLETRAGSHSIRKRVELEITPLEVFP